MGKTVNRDIMRLALEMGFSRIGQTSPNPPVGAVLVGEETVICTGCTCACGSDHAEVDAIKKAGTRARGADLYVTLEPCCHYGRTPPCTEAIIEAGITRVITPMEDPNPLVAGRGLERLREAGVEVVLMAEMREQAADLLRPFTRYILDGRAFVVHKSAMTLDGRTADFDGVSKWISSEHSRYIVHRLRAMVDAVIVGVNTLLRDNPALTVRMDSFPEEVRGFFAENTVPVFGNDGFFFRNLLNFREFCSTGAPRRVIMGVAEGIPEDAAVFSDDNYLFYENAAEEKKLSASGDPVIKKLLKSGRLVLLPGTDEAETVTCAVKDMASRGMMYAMLEGGAGTAGSFFDAGAIDQFLYFIAPGMLG
ncbi:MAG TPA: bifunctional diaminohydroxyphosphoribosylaminopyrimidine deaminase/5-amino-6-(5-phosphoribosylamino)uracil reductase RibD, partial [Spirochaetes bacterium]|nr:bifunctional diaminohydroxyphosphoribosylaminopyrimidine deaminase/5-amino-6-(5-phosphoribosylamino)uracil reductase RibD [Spirochaetota bacterium]